MREMIGEVGKKITKEEKDNPSFFDVAWLIFEILFPITENIFTVLVYI